MNAHGMKRRNTLLALLLAVVGSLLAMGAAAQAAPNTASSTTISLGVPAPAYLPGMDDLMTMLIQPRHIKLHFAGARKNWELAASQQRDLRAAFVRISQYMPRYLGVDVREAVASIMYPKFAEVDAAIAAGDAKKFAESYAGLTAACNSCHEYMEHRHHVIKVPEPSAASPYPDQDFGVE
jgi:hypothetical protein